MMPNQECRSNGQEYDSSFEESFLLQDACNQRVLTGEAWHDVKRDIRATNGFEYTPTGPAMVAQDKKLVEAFLDLSFSQDPITLDEYVQSARKLSSIHPLSESSFFLSQFNGLTPAKIVLSATVEFEDGGTINDAFNQCLAGVKPRFRHVSDLLFHAIRNTPDRDHVLLAITKNLIKMYPAFMGIVDSDGSTTVAALMKREQLSDRKAVFDLLVTDAAVLMQDSKGVSAWQKALVFRRDECFSAMLPIIREQLNEEDQNHWTAAHWIAYSRNHRALRLCMQNGLKLVRNSVGVHPSEIARDNGWMNFGATRKQDHKFSNFTTFSQPDLF